MSDVVSWLSADVPARLRQRVLALCGEVTPGDDPGALIEAAARAGRRVIGADASDRATAFELLAIDAIVTHAVEAMADDPARFEDRCAAALQTLATIPAAT